MEKKAAITIPTKTFPGDVFLIKNFLIKNRFEV